MHSITTECFILTVESRTEGELSKIVLYGASPIGPVKITAKFSPYFFVQANADWSNITKVIPPSSKVGTELFTTLSGMRVLKITFPSVIDAESARVALAPYGLAILESDIRARERFLMDTGLNGGCIITGLGEIRAGVTEFRDPIIRPEKVSVPFVICSLDIETSITSGEILSIAAHITGGKEEVRIVFMRGDETGEYLDKCVFVSDEGMLLKTFETWFQKIDPDIIIGWNVIGFDLTVIGNRAAALRVSCNLGRENRNFFVKESNGRFSQAYITGRIVLDGPQLLKNSFYSFESYSLENVSQKVLGEGKLLKGNRGSEIERLFTEDKRALAEYNIKDTVLVSRIFQKLELFQLTVSRSELSGMLLNQVGLSVAAFDHFYLPRLHRLKYVAPNAGQAGEAISSAGGYVISPVAGIYGGVTSLDFQSLYPSIIRTFNIDPLSRSTADDDSLATPKGFTFSRTKSILPEFIGELMEARANAKKRGNKALSQAIKILMNSFYGVMGSPGSRLYDPALADAITSTGQWLLTESVAWLHQQGHRVIYGDTDSLFVMYDESRESSKHSPSPISPGNIGRDVARQLSEFWRKRLRSEFGVKSYLIVEFKKEYRKFLVPPSRGGDGGAKKRYAGFTVHEGLEQIEFVGFEAVRSDWTKLAQEFQRELYTRIFREEKIDEWVRDFVQKVHAGEFDTKLTYRKRLHKPLGEYGSSPPPYVRAALLMKKPSRDVWYVVTTKGPIPIELAPKDFDYGHYIEKQLKPVADSILEVTGTSFAKIMSKQISLF